MKRIVICCDGTWKRVDARYPTNVVRLAQAVLPQGPDGVAQVVLHLDGVGSGRGTSAVARSLDRMLGGAFGLGLMAPIETAYRFLIFNYAPGDEVYLLGFSRGAFTARSLAGLIRNSGVLARAHAARLPTALALYRGRGPATHPDGKVSRSFRSRFGVRIDGIRYLGVWDTVGALGVPGRRALARRLNRDFGFHDTRLSSWVAAARHAVAIDERRAAFPPTLWDNLAELNAAHPGEARYLQRWFPGDHGSVGGGGAVTALSSDAALWIAEGAAEAGLAIDAAMLAAWAGACDPLGPLAEAASGPFARLLRWRLADRTGPADAVDLAPAARRRWHAVPDYRPGALGQLLAVLEAEAAGG